MSVPQTITPDDMQTAITRAVDFIALQTMDDDDEASDALGLHIQGTGLTAESWSLMIDALLDGPIAAHPIPEAHRLFATTIATLAATLALTARELADERTERSDGSATP